MMMLDLTVCPGEGYGPWSPDYDYEFTDCFLDLISNASRLLLFVFGSIVLAYLWNKSTPSRSLGLLYWSKMVFVANLVCWLRSFIGLFISCCSFYFQQRCLRSANSINRYIDVCYYFTTPRTRQKSSRFYRLVVILVINGNS